MPGKDVFGARDTLEGQVAFYRLSRLEELGVGRVSRLPFSIKILLEAALRTCDGYEVTEDDVRNLAAWSGSPLPRAGEGPGVGAVARYAWGEDYHEVIAEKLGRLVAFIESEAGHTVAHKICVDTSAVLEREWAVRAGLGWIGKNTLLINPHAGSWLLLGELLLDLALDEDAPFPTDHCGSCTRCIERCPTHCILPDRDLDARRCIAYLTIELRGTLPRPADLRSFIGDWVFGCDVCQEVCPWNRFARPTREAAFEPRHATLNLRDLLEMNDETFRAQFARSAIRRARREGLARNASIIAANRTHSEETP
jgi:epoxyqueuosine reductase